MSSLFDPVPAPIKATDGFVLCDFDGITLAIPQADVVTIEQGSELSAALPGESSLGWFASSQGPWPAYALNRELQLLESTPASRSFLLFVQGEPWPLGLLCEGVRIVRGRDTLTTLPLPSVMQEQGGFVEGVTRLEKGKIAFICRRGGIAAYLAEHLMELAA
jgi:CheW-like domain